MSSEVQARFVDPGAAARAVMGVLVIGVLLDIQRLVFAVAHPRIATIGDLPGPTLHAMTRLATVILFVMWFDRVRRNMALLTLTRQPSRSSTFIAFFVPPFCFYRPPRMIQEIWGERGRWFTRLVVIWWIAFLLPPILVLSGLRRGPIGAGEQWWRVVATESLNITAGLLAIAIVSLISARQREQPVQAAARVPGQRRKPVELLIREQGRRRPPLERAAGFFRELMPRRR